MSKIPSDHWLHHLQNGGRAMADIIGDSALAALHERWAPLVDERAALDIEIVDREIAAGIHNKRWVECYGRFCYSDIEIDEAIDEAAESGAGLSRRTGIEQRRGALKAALADQARAWEAGIVVHGIAAFIARLRAVEEEIDATLDEIAAQPVGSFADVAVLLDVAREYNPDWPPDAAADQLHEQNNWELHLVRAVGALSPGFVFTSFRRYFPSLAYDAHGIPIEPAEGAAIEPADRGDDLARCTAALVADYRGPLPPGDAGLIEAERRRNEMASRAKALHREFKPSPEEEEQYIGILQPPDDELWRFINETVPESLVGVAVKLRSLCEADHQNRAELGQCLAAIEREITAAATRHARP